MQNDFVCLDSQHFWKYKGQGVTRTHRSHYTISSLLSLLGLCVLLFVEVNDFRGTPGLSVWLPKLTLNIIKTLWQKLTCWLNVCNQDHNGLSQMSLAICVTVSSMIMYLIWMYIIINPTERRRKKHQSYIFDNHI